MREEGIKVEPYWNVNQVKVGQYTDFTQIKVEPYWNVNLLYIYIKRSLKPH